ncbi:Holliday junction branch migration protein RuvA [Roseospira marina]|uniref:Holliday junction branch migration complex subunit RuvA n=1 Tax=Roseospira marina TaxID=140057 RepID=A0A5M6IB09_9PROT|nr:Holliday junction branch migration protein RuvA [Roseospira marina]KAA5605147.1 Holliday junction branch migration protein RuvA [Roseospira marina]MBB4314902.1 Holliday junction DNA helicase RuvA [Roseospira marina]MBB5087902.1 Holliday junction DNA helicase RuvA [Roseospira marina]
MIAALRGIVLEAGEDGLVLDVHGVGYLVFCSGRTLARLPAPGGEVALVVETQVREDHIHLYGFIDALERDCFRLLSTVQGVGAKVALAILSVVPAEQMGRVLAAQDKAMLTRAAGVGPKLAGRIVAELKDKAARLGALPVASPAGVALPDVPAATSAGLAGGVVDDATSALVNLGYGRAEAWTAASEAASALGDAATVETTLGEALRALGRGE